MRDEKVLIRVITLYVCPTRRRDVPRAQRIPRHVPMTTAVNLTGSINVISIIKQSTSLATSSRPGRSLVKQTERIQSRGDVQLIARADDGGRRRERLHARSRHCAEKDTYPSGPSPPPGSVSLSSTSATIATGAGDDGLDAADGDAAHSTTPSLASMETRVHRRAHVALLTSVVHVDGDVRRRRVIHDDAVAAEGHGARVRVHGRELRHGTGAFTVERYARMRVSSSSRRARTPPVPRRWIDVDVTRKGV